MFNVGMRDALSIWSELEQCWHRTNGFGTDTAEIYAYRLQRASNLTKLGIQAGEKPSSLEREAMEDDARAAATGLASILALFVEMRDCSIDVNDEPFDPKRGLEPFLHRVHVRVIRNERKKR